MMRFRREREGECEPLTWPEQFSVWFIRISDDLNKFRHHLVLPGAGFVVFTTVVYGVMRQLKDQDVFGQEEWKGDAVGNLILVSSGIAVLVGSALVAVGYGLMLRRAGKDSELEEACKAVWIIVLRATGIDMDKVGVHVWGVRGLRGMQRLERRARFTVARRKDTPVTWRKGKGAIGLAWENDESLVANVEHLDAQARNKAQFCALPEEERFGLNWREFRKSRHYRAVLAIPLQVGGPSSFRVGGCLSVDVQVDGQANLLDTLTAGNEFSAVINVCERVLGRTDDTD